MITAEKERVPPVGEISEIHMEKVSGIHCITKTEGLEISMGWDDFAEKLKRLSLVWADLQKRGLSVPSIDCSDLKRMVAKKASGGGERGRR